MTGFSMKPGAFPRPFTNRSDLDIAVVCETEFDLFWSTFQMWAYPRRTQQLPRDELTWFKSRRKDVFWGWLYPTEIRYEGLAFPRVLTPIRDASAKWFGAFQGLSRDPELAQWPIRARLYRSEEHLIRYHADGVRQLSEEIRQREEVEP